MGLTAYQIDDKSVRVNVSNPQGRNRGGQVPKDERAEIRRKRRRREINGLAAHGVVTSSSCSTSASDRPR